MVYHGYKQLTFVFKRSCKNNFRVFRIVPQRDRDLTQNLKSKIRNPKLEIRNKPEGPKSESQNQAASRCFEAWSFRVLNLFRISDFELRICRASNSGWAGVRIAPESRILFLHRPLIPAIPAAVSRRAPVACNPDCRAG